MSESFLGARIEAARASMRRDPIIWSTVLILAVLDLAVSNRYDTFRNELYFIVCGRHPAFGYPDAPPLVSLIAAATQVFGDHTWMLRVPTIAAAIALIPLTAAFARELGGSRTAAWMAALAVGIAPELLGQAGTLSTQSFEPLTWTACSYLLFRVAYREDRSAALWAGIIAGIAIEAKYGLLIWAFGLAAGTMLTPARRVFGYRQLWYGAIIGIVIAAPSFLWQATHGFPLAHSAAYSRRYMNLRGTPLQFEAKQIVAMNAALAPIWITGVIAPFFSARAREARFLAIAFVVTIAAFFAAGGKDYYVMGAYPTMFAVGAVVCATWKRWIRAAMIGGALALAIIQAPIVLPILDPPVLAKYMDATHLRPPPVERQSLGAPLTHLFSDQMGWRNLEKQVASVYRSLTPQERSHTAIIAENYGEAAAIDVYGHEDGLPPAICTQYAYYFWGTHGYDGSVNIIVKGNLRRIQGECATTEVVGQFSAPYAMPYEKGPIFVCRGLRDPLDQLWLRFRQRF